MYQSKGTSDILKLAKSSKKYLDFLDVLLAAQVQLYYNISFKVIQLNSRMMMDVA